MAEEMMGASLRTGPMPGGPVPKEAVQSAWAITGAAGQRPPGVTGTAEGGGGPIFKPPSVYGVPHFGSTRCLGDQTSRRMA